MIQRIQTLYLLGVAAIGILMVFFPLAEITGYEKSCLLRASGIIDAGTGAKITGAIPLLCLVGLSAVVALLAVFLHKNRKKQVRLCKANLLVLASILASVFLYAIDAKDLTVSPGDAIISYRWSAYLPFLSMLLSLLAARAIKKDDDLVKSVDRIR